MTSIQRTLKCSNCGNESSISVNSDIDVKELLFAGKCRCGTAMQINYSIIDTSADIKATDSSSTSTAGSTDDALFTSEFPSEAIKELVEE